jgi:hypothetical protein
MRAVRLPLLVLLAVPVLAARAPGQAALPADLPTDLTGPLRKDLEVFARWAGPNGLLREQHRACAVIVRLDPDHAEARKVLQFSRKKDGTWVRVFQYAEPKATNEKLRAECETRWSTLVGAFRQKATDAMAKDPTLRARLLEELLALTPEDAALREEAGEVKHKGIWVLTETIAARQRSAELVRLARTLLQAVEKPEPATPAGDESGWGVRWSAALQTPAVRGLGTVREDEVDRAVRQADAAAEVFRQALGVKARNAVGFTVYLLLPEHKATVVANAPFARPEDRKLAGTLQSFWIAGGSRVATAAEQAEQRLEWCVRQTISDLLRWQFGITVERGALFEGIGLYFTWLCTGMRTTWYVQPDQNRYARGPKTMTDRLREANASWLAEAHKLMDKGPWLDTLLRKNVLAMNGEDLVLAFAFAQWLVEGQDEVAVRFLTEAGKGTPPDQTLPAHFRMDSVAIEARIRRWIHESR